MKIFCNECNKEVDANLVTGDNVYPHRQDLYNLHFWVCPNCSAFVGTHKNSPDHKPLGTLAGPNLRKWRNWVHFNIDSYWRTGITTRKNMYKQLSKKFDGEFHTAKLKTKQECEQAVSYAEELYGSMTQIKTLRRTKVILGD